MSDNICAPAIPVNIICFPQNPPTFAQKMPPEVGNWKMQTGKLKLENRSWKVETGN
jgi:hypothetical protein